MNSGVVLRRRVVRLHIVLRAAWRRKIHELITGAASSSRVAKEDAAFDKFPDIPQRGVLGAFRKLRPFRGGEFALEPIEKAGKHIALALIQREARNTLPKPVLVQHRVKGCPGAVNGPFQAIQKPVHPYGNVHRALLGRFQYFVIVCALLPDLRRHAVEALRALFGTGQRHVGNGPGDPPVAVFKRMDGDKPEVGQSGPEHPIHFVGLVEPLEKTCHFPVKPLGRRRLEMHPLMTDRAGNHLHGAGTIITPGPRSNPPQTPVAVREQPGAPVP